MPWHPNTISAEEPTCRDKPIIFLETKRLMSAQCTKPPKISPTAMGSPQYLVGAIDITEKDKGHA